MYVITQYGADLLAAKAVEEERDTGNDTESVNMHWEGTRLA